VGRIVKAVAKAIGEELIEIHRESYGHGAESVSVLVGEDAVVVFLDDIELAQNEKFLIEAGDGDAVIDYRTRYQRAIDARFTAAVERATGRRVTSFVSATKLSPNYAVEVFRLAPAEEVMQQ